VHHVASWYGLLNDIASNLHHIVLNSRIMVNGELELEGIDSDLFGVLSQVLIEVTEEKYEKS
jgi:hypothetical protein